MPFAFFSCHILSSLPSLGFLRNPKYDTHHYLRNFSSQPGRILPFRLPAVTGYFVAHYKILQTRRLGLVLGNRSPPRPLWRPSGGGTQDSRASRRFRASAGLMRRGRSRGLKGLVGARRRGVVTSGRKRTLREAAQNPAVTGISVAPRTLVSLSPGSGCVGRACSSLRPWRPGLTPPRPLPPPPPRRPPRARAAPAPARPPRRRPRREGS